MVTVITSDDGLVSVVSITSVVHHPDTDPDRVMTGVTTDTLRDTLHLPRDKM